MAKRFRHQPDSKNSVAGDSSQLAPTNTDSTTGNVPINLEEPPTCPVVYVNIAIDRNKVEHDDTQSTTVSLETKIESYPQHLPRAQARGDFDCNLMQTRHANSPVPETDETGHDNPQPNPAPSAQPEIDSNNPQFGPPQNPAPEIDPDNPQSKPELDSNNPLSGPSKSPTPTVDPRLISPKQDHGPLQDPEQKTDLNNPQAGSSQTPEQEIDSNNPQPRISQDPEIGSRNRSPSPSEESTGDYDPEDSNVSDCTDYYLESEDETSYYTGGALDDFYEEDTPMTESYTRFVQPLEPSLYVKTELDQNYDEELPLHTEMEMYNNNNLGSTGLSREVIDDINLNNQRVHSAAAKWMFPEEMLNRTSGSEEMAETVPPTIDFNNPRPGPSRCRDPELHFNYPGADKPCCREQPLTSDYVADAPEERPHTTPPPSVKGHDSDESEELNVVDQVSQCSDDCICQLPIEDQENLINIQEFDLKSNKKGKSIVRPYQRCQKIQQLEQELRDRRLRSSRTLVQSSMPTPETSPPSSFHHCKWDEEDEVPCLGDPNLNTTSLDDSMQVNVDDDPRIFLQPQMLQRRVAAKRLKRDTACNITMTSLPSRCESPKRRRTDSETSEQRFKEANFPDSEGPASPVSPPKRCKPTLSPTSSMSINYDAYECLDESHELSLLLATSEEALSDQSLTDHYGDASEDRHCIYEDTDNFLAEISEFYSYHEVDEYTSHVEAFKQVALRWNFDWNWRRLPQEDKNALIAQLLEELDVVEDSQTGNILKAFVYLAEGCWYGVETLNDFINNMRENIIFLVRNGAFGTFFDLLIVKLELMKKGKFTGKDSVELEDILAVLYFMVEIMRNEKFCQSTSYKKEANRFIDDLQQPVQDELLILKLMRMVVLFTNMNIEITNQFPIKKVVLLLWKSFMMTFCGVKALDNKREKRLRRRGKSKIQQNDFCSFLSYYYLKFLGRSLPHQIFSVGNLLPRQIRTNIECLSARVEQIKKHEDQEYEETPEEELNIPNLTEPPLIEKFYKSMYPELKTYLEGLVKIILYSNEEDHPVSKLLQRHDIIEMGHRTSDDLDANIAAQKILADSIRQSNIILKAISAILLLLLKHLKNNCIRQFDYALENLAKLGLDTFIMKFFDKDISEFIHRPRDIEILSFPNCLIGPQPELTLSHFYEERSDYISWRNKFTCINLQRVLNKVVKWKNFRIQLIPEAPKGRLVERLSDVPNRTYSTYAMKLLKILIDYFYAMRRTPQTETTLENIVRAIYMHMSTTKIKIRPITPPSSGESSSRLEDERTRMALTFAVQHPSLLTLLNTELELLPTDDSIRFEDDGCVIISARPCVPSDDQSSDNQTNVPPNHQVNFQSETESDSEVDSVVHHPSAETLQGIYPDFDTSFDTSSDVPSLSLDDECPKITKIVKYPYVYFVEKSPPEKRLMIVVDRETNMEYTFEERSSDSKSDDEKLQITDQISISLPKNFLAMINGYDLKSCEKLIPKIIVTKADQSSPENPDDGPSCSKTSQMKFDAAKPGPSKPRVDSASSSFQQRPCRPSSTSSVGKLTPIEEVTLKSSDELDVPVENPFYASSAKGKAIITSKGILIGKAIRSKGVTKKPTERPGTSSRLLEQPTSSDTVTENPPTLRRSTENPEVSSSSSVKSEETSSTARRSDGDKEKPTTSTSSSMKFKEKPSSTRREVDDNDKPTISKSSPRIPKEKAPCSRCTKRSNDKPNPLSSSPSKRKRNPHPLRRSTGTTERPNPLKSSLVESKEKPQCSQRSIGDNVRPSTSSSSQMKSKEKPSSTRQSVGDNVKPSTSSSSQMKSQEKPQSSRQSLGQHEKYSTAKYSEGKIKRASLDLAPSKKSIERPSTSTKKKPNELAAEKPKTPNIPSRKKPSEAPSTTSILDDAPSERLGSSSNAERTSYQRDEQASIPRNGGEHSKKNIPKNVRSELPGVVKCADKDPNETKKSSGKSEDNSQQQGTSGNQSTTSQASTSQPSTSQAAGSSQSGDQDPNDDKPKPGRSLKSKHEESTSESQNKTKRKRLDQSTSCNGNENGIKSKPQTTSQPPQQPKSSSTSTTVEPTVKIHPPQKRTSQGEIKIPPGTIPQPSTSQQTDTFPKSKKLCTHDKTVTSTDETTQSGPMYRKSKSAPHLCRSSCRLDQHVMSQRYASRPSSYFQRPRVVEESRTPSSESTTTQPSGSTVQFTPQTLLDLSVDIRYISLQYVRDRYGTTAITAEQLAYLFYEEELHERFMQRLINFVAQRQSPHHAGEPIANPNIEDQGTDNDNIEEQPSNDQDDEEQPFNDQDDEDLSFGSPNSGVLPFYEPDYDDEPLFYPNNGVRHMDDSNHEDQSVSDSDFEAHIFFEPNIGHQPLDNSNNDVQPINDPNNGEQPTNDPNIEQEPIDDQNIDQEPIDDQNIEQHFLIDPIPERQPIDDTGSEEQSPESLDSQEPPIHDPCIEQEPSDLSNIQEQSLGSSGDEGVERRRFIPVEHHESPEPKVRKDLLMSSAVIPDTSDPSSSLNLEAARSITFDSERHLRESEQEWSEERRRHYSEYQQTESFLEAEREIEDVYYRPDDYPQSTAGQECSTAGSTVELTQENVDKEESLPSPANSQDFNESTDSQNGADSHPVPETNDSRDADCSGNEAEDGFQDSSRGRGKVGPPPSFFQAPTTEDSSDKLSEDIHVGPSRTEDSSDILKEEVKAGPSRTEDSSDSLNKDVQAGPSKPRDSSDSPNRDVQAGPSKTEDSSDGQDGDVRSELLKSEDSSDVASEDRHVDGCSTDADRYIDTDVDSQDTESSTDNNREVKRLKWSSRDEEVDATAMHTGESTDSNPESRDTEGLLDKSREQEDSSDEATRQEMASSSRKRLKFMLKDRVEREPQEDSSSSN